MSSQLSKLHIRFIQTQGTFFLVKESQSKGEKVPLNQLYIKNSGSFYFVNLGDPVRDGQEVTLLFKEPNDYLKSLRCTVTAHDIQRSGGEFDDALRELAAAGFGVRQLRAQSGATHRG